MVYSDNGGTFNKTSKWLHQLRKDECLQGLLDEYEINWKFNLSCAPWWGGQFERLIEVVKSAMYKVIGTIERPIQHLYPLEIACDKDTVRDTS